MEPTPSGATATQRRAFHYRDLEAAGAQFETVQDAAVAWAYGSDGEADTARRLGLADLSPLARTGFKGRDTAPGSTPRGSKSARRPTKPIHAARVRSPRVWRRVRSCYLAAATAPTTLRPR